MLTTVGSWFRSGLELSVAGLTKCVFHREELCHRIVHLGFRAVNLSFKKKTQLLDQLYAFK